MEKRNCLICSREVPKGDLINHIAEHINYKRHRCNQCVFRSVRMETMVDHQTSTGHKVAFDGNKNWYLDRICQLVYSDFEYARKNGELVLKGFGAVYGDRKRLNMMLKTGELKDDKDMDIEIEDDNVANSDTAIEQADTILGRKQSHNSSPIRRVNSSSMNASLQPRRSQDQYSSSETELDPTPAPQTSAQKLLRIRTAPADSSSHMTDANQLQSTRRLLDEIDRQITKGIKHIKCKKCTMVVQNEYAAKKEHLEKKHPSGGNISMSTQMNQCFGRPGHILIVNDLQCNVCGRECNYRVARYHHVAEMHTDYRWKCVINSCEFVIVSKKKFNEHLNKFHNQHLGHLVGEERDKYVMFNNDFEIKLTPLVRKCFPFDLPIRNLKRTTNTNEEVDSSARVELGPSVQNLGTKESRSSQQLPDDDYESDSDTDVKADQSMAQNDTNAALQYMRIGQNNQQKFGENSGQLSLVPSTSAAQRRGRGGRGRGMFRRSFINRRKFEERNPIKKNKKARMNPEEMAFHFNYMY